MTTQGSGTLGLHWKREKHQRYPLSGSCITRDSLGITRAHHTLLPGNKAIHFCSGCRNYTWSQKCHFLCNQTTWDASKTGCFFCTVTAVLKATTIDPNPEHTWRLLSDILGALNIINGLRLPLSPEICFSQSALATGKQMRQMLWKRGLGHFTVDPTLSLKDFW